MLGGKLVLIDSLFYQYQFSGEEADGIKFLPMMSSITSNPVYRFFRKIHLSSALPGKKIWFDKRAWASIKNYQTVVLADTGNVANVVRLIKSKWPDKRVIVWYRNPVSNTISPEQEFSDLCELWSFDREDCLKYGMYYNPQFYFKRDVGNLEVDTDVFFVGQDKGRLDTILSLQKEFEEQGLTTNFEIMGYNSERLTYTEVIEQVARSRAVLDITAKGQRGMTLRPLEALFYRKKLITNNSDIVNQDFYSKQNVFLLGKDSLEGIREFVSSDFSPVDSEICSNYTVKKWAERFDAVNDLSVFERNL